MRNKMPWVDVERCDISERCEECKASRLCPHGAFRVVRSSGGNGQESCLVQIDFERCRLCGNCSHACERGAVRMI